MTNTWQKLLSSKISIGLNVASYKENTQINGSRVSVDSDGDYWLQNNTCNWLCSLRLVSPENGIINGLAEFKLKTGTEFYGNIAVSLTFDDWSVDNYVLLPAAAYNGNRFNVVQTKYPPYLHDDAGNCKDINITNVPHLNTGAGNSEIHLCSGDMSTPCVGIWMPSDQKGFLLLFEHVTAFGYTGVKLTESEDRSCSVINLEAPVVRQRKYSMMNPDFPSDDTGVVFHQGDVITLRFKMLLFDCIDISSLFDTFFEHRKDICGSRNIAHELPFSAAYRIIEKKYNESQFNEKFGYYMLSPNGQGSTFGDWQAGWCGGGLSSLALLYNGTSLSRERANRTMDAIFGRLQNKNGFILPIFSDGRPLGDDFCHQDRSEVLLIRKDADVLVFAARHILLLFKRREYVPQYWLNGLAMLADAFVRLWEHHGQFGQFIDIKTEEMLISGTAAGSMAPGGLALAWKVLGDIRYLQAAKESARYYYREHVMKGLLNGGPGEILQCPDSESAFGMLESFIILYETTGNTEWIPMAEDTARHCASWCVSYDFTFPTGSEFERLGIRTLGSVYANVQNKHSAPGICTLSGASLLRLYRATGDQRYLELCKEVAHNITQYLSRGDKPIITWDGRLLPPGWMCERVNMSDWEGKELVGGVFWGSNWCEVSCLLTYAEIPSIWFLTDTGEAIVIDHVEVSVTNLGDTWQLLISNPTDFAVEVKLLAETQTNLLIPWEQCILDDCRIIPIEAHNNVIVYIAKQQLNPVVS